MLTDVDNLPVYPIGTDARTENRRVMVWPYEWWLRSEVHLLGELDVKAIAFDLFCIAQGEVPPGTLPTDERKLAKLVGEKLETWQLLQDRTVTPLNGWELCQCEGVGVRYFHPVSVEITLAALSGNEKE